MTSVAIAHDYLTQRGGAERVVLLMLKAFPDATIYTTLYDPDSTYPEFRDARIVTSPLNRVAPLRRHHRTALPLLPWAAGRLHIPEDVVLSSSSGWAHGFDAQGVRIVYCHAPARWLYQTASYAGSSPSGWAKSAVALGLRPYLLRWDVRQAAKAHRYLTNSRVVQQRVLDAYGRASEVLPPPHSLDPEAPRTPVQALTDWSDSGYHLVVSRLLPYKNVDVAVEVFADLHDERLVVVGDGPESERLARRAGRNVRMLSGLTDREMRWVYAHATALLAPSIEDYGLTPLEAASFGKPTLALRGGGYLDTVEPGVSGEFFDAATVPELRAAVLSNTMREWDGSRIRLHAERFGEAPFVARLRAIVAAVSPPAERRPTRTARAKQGNRAVQD
jgi:glycosyltransferase involved in cell wall biosynthesis